MMGSLLYVITYTAVARNVSAVALSSELGAVARDLEFEATVGLTCLSDVTVDFSQLYARRSISYTAGPSAIASDAVMGSFLTNIYTSKLSQALSTPVLRSRVLVVPSPETPLLWTNAQYGVTAAGDQWKDMSGNRNDLLQIVGANRPAQNPNGAGPDVATVHFAGGAKFLLSVAPLAFDEFTYLMTFRSPLLSTPGVLLERSLDATAHSGERLYQSTGASHSILARRAGVVHSADFAAGWGVDGNWHLAAFVYSRALGGQLFVDGQLDASFAPLAAEAVSQTLYVGAQAAGTLPITGDIREIFAFPVALSTDEIATMAAYMNPQVGL